MFSVSRRTGNANERLVMYTKATRINPSQGGTRMNEECEITVSEAMLAMGRQGGFVNARASPQVTDGGSAR